MSVKTELADFFISNIMSLKNSIAAVADTIVPRPKLGDKIKKLLRPRRRFSIAAALLLFLILGGIWAAAKYGKQSEPEEPLTDPRAKEIKTMTLDRENRTAIKAVGTVKADSKIDVVALAGGTIKNLTFAVGDRVFAGGILASLNDNTVLTNLINAENNFANLQSSLILSRSMTEQSLRQASLGVDTAREGVAAAEIAAEAANNNLLNYDALRGKGDEDTKHNAVIAFNGHLNTIWSALDQVNYLIKAEGSLQLPGVENILGVKDLSSLSAAKQNYSKLKKSYLSLNDLSPAEDTITSAMAALSDALALTKQLVDGTIAVLDNTITSAEFPDSALAAQKNSFSGLRANIVGAQTAAGATRQALENLSLINTQERDALVSALNTANNRLTSAKTAFSNSLVGEENARLLSENQVLSAQTALDGARSQLNLARVAAGDLSVKAPISGVITAKYVDIGAEMNPGQPIAQISQAEMMKIETSLPSEDIYRIAIGQEAIIGNELKAVVSSIDPAADPVTRKVKLEIVFDNKNGELIQETFVDIVIPVKTGAESIYVPLKTVTVTQTESYVFVIKDDRAVKTPVILGKTEAEFIEVLSGLNRGDTLAVDGAKNLIDGDEVKITD